MATTWDAAFQSTPDGGDSPESGDDKIRELKGALQERIDKEHWMTTGSGALSGHGIHRSGAAVVYAQAVVPTNQPDGSTSLGSNDSGRVWIDTDNDLLYYYDGSAWFGLLRIVLRVSFSGVLATGTDLAPPIILPRAGTIQKVSGRVGTDPAGADILVDINKNGSSSVFATSGNRLTISAATSSGTSTGIDAINGVLAADDYLTVDIDQVGSSTPGSDLGIAIDVILG